MGGIEKTWTECFYPICAIQEEVKVSRRKPAVFFQIFHGPVNVKTVEYSTSLTLKLSFRLSSLLNRSPPALPPPPYLMEPPYELFKLIKDGGCCTLSRNKKKLITVRLCKILPFTHR